MKYQLFSKNLHYFFHLEVLNFREILFNCLKNEKMLHSLKIFCSQPLKLGSEYDLKMSDQIRSDQIRSLFQNAIWSDLRSYFAQMILIWSQIREKVIWPYSEIKDVIFIHFWIFFSQQWQSFWKYWSQARNQRRTIGRRPGKCWNLCGWSNDHRQTTGTRN